MAGKELISIAC